MPIVKKTKPVSFEIIDENKAISALEIHSFVYNKNDGLIDPSNEDEKKQEERVDEFEKEYHHSYYDTVVTILRWTLYIFRSEKWRSVKEIYNDYVVGVSLSNKQPMKLVHYDGWNNTGRYEWVFKGFVYEVKGYYSDDEIILLILEDFDKERSYFEKLNVKFNQSANTNTTYERPRIPESVRIEVWRRDSGKCARCGSREKLEYDHIVPISKGGSNTARNIELLCEKCNRSKSNNVV